MMADSASPPLRGVHATLEPLNTLAADDFLEAATIFKAGSEVTNQPPVVSFTFAQLVTGVANPQLTDHNTPVASRTFWGPRAHALACHPGGVRINTASVAGERG